MTMLTPSTGCSSENFEDNHFEGVQEFWLDHQLTNLDILIEKLEQYTAAC